jgi:hypothetical protein
MGPVTARAPLEPTRTAVGSRFGKFGPEEEKSSRKAEVQETEAVRQMKAAWKAWRYNVVRGADTYYEAVLSIVENLRYTAEDVEGFSLALGELQDEEDFTKKAGLFLSALINNGKDSGYVIHTKHLAEPLILLGYFNEKNIIVNGDGGDCVGFKMENGSITVKGDASSDVGYGIKKGSIIIGGNAGYKVGSNMDGGSIIVGGNAGDRVGYCMTFGSITVNGNAFHNVGWEMKCGSISVKGNAGEGVGIFAKGGEIRLEGDYGGLSEDIRGGRIYHKGKLIFPK